MPRKDGSPLALRRMPLVVIPRKRKYKNYVSRRRNNQLLASLRKCSSDPNLYRSYNHWKSLFRPFTPATEAQPAAAPAPVITKPAPAPAAVKPAAPAPAVVKPAPPAPVVVKPAPPAPVVEPPAPASVVVDTPNDVVPPKPPVTKQISGKLTELKKTDAAKASLRIPPKHRAAESVQTDSSVSDSPCSTASSRLPAPVLPQPPPATAVVPPQPSPQPVKNSAAVKPPPLMTKTSSIDSPVKTTKPLSKQLSLQKPPLDGKPPVQNIKSAAPSPTSIPKNQHDSLSSSVKSPESVRRIDGIEFIPRPDPATTPSAPKSLRKAYGSKSGTTICAVGAPIGVASTSTAAAPSATAEDQRLIEKKLSIRRKKDPKESGGLPVVSKSGVDLVDKSDQAAERRAKKTVNAVAAAFSTVDADKKEKPPKEVVAKPPSPNVNPLANSLLAQLQLPPSVSAKVDRIIACGDKSRRSKVVSQVRKGKRKAAMWC